MFLILVVENIYIYLVGKYTNKKDTGQYLIIGIFTFEYIITLNILFVSSLVIRFS